MFDIMEDLKENTQKKIMEKLVLSAALGMFCYCSNNVTMGMDTSEVIITDEQTNNEQQRRIIENTEPNNEKQQQIIKNIETINNSPTNDEMPVETNNNNNNNISTNNIQEEKKEEKGKIPSQLSENKKLKEIVQQIQVSPTKKTDINEDEQDEECCPCCCCCEKTKPVVEEKEGEKNSKKNETISPNNEGENDEVKIINEDNQEQIQISGK